MKKDIWFFAASIVQLVIGIMAIAAFPILAIGGEEIAKWIPAFLLAIALIVHAILDLSARRSKK